LDQTGLIIYIDHGVPLDIFRKDKEQEHHDQDRKPEFKKNEYILDSEKNVLFE
jgi:hypothetical protein